MNISRKDFFKQGLFSLGEVIRSVGGVLDSSTEPAVIVPDMADVVFEPHEDLAAVARNETCLARNSGCFACMERCASGAIKLIPGVGVRINQQLCSGCGSCEYVCPVSPKAIRMQARTIQPSSADHEERPPQKGETSC